ncbi:MAG: hypothetical protein ABI832_20170 [bacterium]
MANLFLASNLVGLEAGHLQIVFQADPLDLAALQEVEVQAPPDFFQGNWRYPAFGRDHASHTDHYGEADNYKIVALDGPGHNADQMWQLFGQLDASFRVYGSEINYEFLQNSNSFVTTLLWALGIDLADYDMTTAGISYFPGDAANVLLGAHTDAGLVTPIAVKVALTAFDDVLHTGIGNDSIGGLMGSAGDDRVWLGGGDDTVAGGTGQDRLHGQSGNDTVLGGGGEDLLFGGLGDDIMLGGTGKDSLYGGRGDDSLYGGYNVDGMTGSQSDVIDGGLGSDFLSGGEGRGRDRFVFHSIDETAAGDGRDTIFLMKQADLIDLSLIDANIGRDGDQAFRFHGASPHAFQLWYEDLGKGNYLISGDVTGDRRADFEIGLQEFSGSLDRGNFVL